MAYTLLAAGTGLLTETSRAGVNLGTGAVAAAAGGNSFANDGNVLIYLASTSASIITASFVAPNAVDAYGNLTVSPYVITIPAGNVTVQRILTPRWPRTIYNQTDGTVHIDFSSVSGLTIAAVQQFRELTQ